jgi:hypothetical protein
LARRQYGAYRCLLAPTGAYSIEEPTGMTHIR